MSFVLMVVLGPVIGTPLKDRLRSIELLKQ